MRPPEKSRRDIAQIAGNFASALSYENILALLDLPAQNKFFLAAAWTR